MGEVIEVGSAVTDGGAGGAGAERLLSKTRFKLAVGCPTRLRYEGDPRYYNAASDDDFLAALADNGHQVGVLAKYLFPGGIEVEERASAAAVDRTKELLAAPSVDLFEAAFRHERLLVRVDLLSRRDRRIDLFEVKSKSFDPSEGEDAFVGKKGLKSEFLEYLQDLAFQRHVLRHALGPGFELRCFLVMPNKLASSSAAVLTRLRVSRVDGRVRVDIDERFDGATAAKELLAVVPVDRYLDLIEASGLEAGGYAYSFTDGVAAFSNALDGEGIPPRIGPHCKQCSYRTRVEHRQSGYRDGRLECWQQTAGLSAAAFHSGTVLDLAGCRPGQLNSLLQARTFVLAEIDHRALWAGEPSDKLEQKHVQALQVQEARGEQVGAFVLKDVLAEALAQLAYPIHFVDFETASPALPFHAGRRPYEQVHFQYSHHLIDDRGNIRHASEYLHAVPETFPNFETVRALRTSVGSVGSVVHWWDHERTVLSHVRAQLAASQELDREELVAFIDQLLGRMLDLGRLYSRTVFLPGTRGKSSLKFVLPALLAQLRDLAERHAHPSYGASGGIPSKNFRDHAWVQVRDDGALVDPYRLLGERFTDPVLSALDADEERFVANGGAAMAAYGELQDSTLAPPHRADLERQLLRYCELDTFAMVIAYQGAIALCNGRAGT